MTNLREFGERAFRSGCNVTESLRSHLGSAQNTPEVIEIAYELQAGSFVRFAEENLAFMLSYSRQLASHLRPHLEVNDTLLDAGAGEMTVLSHMVAALNLRLSVIYACDISESMLQNGQQYARKHMAGQELQIFKAEISAIPLPDKSVDVITTHHALEPNGGREADLLRELLRVARRKLVLFEPCFELASEEARDRMKQHGYIRELASHARELGADVENVTPLQTVRNPLNPTTCFVIRPQA